MARDEHARPVGPLVHGAFVVEVELDRAAPTVFRAFSELPLRERWFRLPAEQGSGRHLLDFRVGGSEVATGTFVGNGVSEALEYRSRFLDIVWGQRIVLAYDVIIDGRRRWASLVAIEFADHEGITTITWTEHYVFLETSAAGADDVAHLEGGTRLRLNGLATAVEPLLGRP